MGSMRDGMADWVKRAWRSVVCWERTDRSARVEWMSGREERKE